MDTAPPSVTLFEEVQYFRRSWITRIVLFSCVIVMGTSLYGLYLEFTVRRMIVGDTGAIDSAIFLSSIMLAVACLLFWLGMVMRLQVRVRPDELVIELYPLIRRAYRAASVSGWQPPPPDTGNKKRPLFGGNTGWASAVTGGREVILRLSGGRRLAVGVQDVGAFIRALETLKSSH